jgi:hypothetical protein
VPEHLHEELNERLRPPQVLRRKLGEETEGFRVREDGEPVRPGDE